MWFYTHISSNWDTLWFWGEVFEVFYLKCKPLPIVKRRPFFFSLKLLFSIGTFFMLMDWSPQRSENLSWLPVTNVLPLDVKKLILQLPPYVSACDYTVKFSCLLLFEGFTIFSQLGNQLGPYIFVNSGCEVLARAELFEGICHVS